MGLYGLALVAQEAVPKSPQHYSWRYTSGVLGVRTTLALSGAVGTAVFGVLWFIGSCGSSATVRTPS